MRNSIFINNFTLLITTAVTLILFSTMVNSKEREHHNRHHTNTTTEFSEAEIFLEQNYTDGDTEVVIRAKGGDIGLRKFYLYDPKGRLVYKFKSPDNGHNIGGREIAIESPEPADMNIVLNAYPQGVYSFIGEALDHTHLFSQAQLFHKLPAPATITYPVQSSTVSRHGLVITWEPVATAGHYLVELKNEETDLSLEATVPAAQQQFTAPSAWLQANKEYQLSIFVHDVNGNVVASEINFFTASE